MLVEDEFWKPKSSTPTTRPNSGNQSLTNWRWVDPDTTSPRHETFHEPNVWRMRSKYEIENVCFFSVWRTFIGNLSCVRYSDGRQWNIFPKDSCLQVATPVLENQFSVGVQGWEQSIPGVGKRVDEYCKEFPPTFCFVQCSANSVVNILTSVSQEMQTLVSCCVSLRRTIANSYALKTTFLQRYWCVLELFFHKRHQKLLNLQLDSEWRLLKFYVFRSFFLVELLEHVKIVEKLTLYDKHSECIWHFTTSFSFCSTWRNTCCSNNIWLLGQRGIYRVSNPINCATRLSFFFIRPSYRFWAPCNSCIIIISRFSGDPTHSERLSLWLSNSLRAPSAEILFPMLNSWDSKLKIIFSYPTNPCKESARISPPLADSTCLTGEFDISLISQCRFERTEENAGKELLIELLVGFLPNGIGVAWPFLVSKFLRAVELCLVS